MFYNFVCVLCCFQSICNKVQNAEQEGQQSRLSQVSVNKKNKQTDKQANKQVKQARTQTKKPIRKESNKQTIEYTKNGSHDGELSENSPCIDKSFNQIKGLHKINNHKSISLQKKNKLTKRQETNHNSVNQTDRQMKKFCCERKN